MQVEPQVLRIRGTFMDFVPESDRPPSPKHRSCSPQTDWRRYGREGEVEYLHDFIGQMQTVESDGISNGASSRMQDRPKKPHRLPIPKWVPADTYISQTVESLPSQGGTLDSLPSIGRGRTCTVDSLPQFFTSDSLPPLAPCDEGDEVEEILPRDTNGTNGTNGSVEERLTLESQSQATTQFSDERRDSMQAILELQERAAVTGADIEQANVTTLMLRNIPYNLTEEQLAHICSIVGFAGAFDFLYVPPSRYTKNKFSNKGYAFINFHSPKAAATFQTRLNGCQLPGTNSDRCVDVRVAVFQGLEACKEGANKTGSRARAGQPFE